VKEYTFEELSEEAQKKAIDQMSDVNVEMCIWWHTIEDQAEKFGIKIVDFDLEKSTIELELTGSRDEICAKIRSGLSEEDDLGHIARHFSDEYLGCNRNAFKRAFKTALNYYYLETLKAEFEWHTCDANVQDTIQNMDIMYYEDGTISEDKK